MDKFYAWFCEVQIVCHGAEPNWLGWIAIAALGWCLLAFVVGFINWLGSI
ncbi:MAG: hypothetical protein ACR2PR_08130 [Pseudohongiellaceae bacterium]